MCIVMWNSPAPTRSADRAQPSPRLLRAYRETHYRAGGTDVRIGRRSPAMDALLARHNARRGVFVTAWNPRSRRMPAGWNARMQQHLRQRLRRALCLPADGAGRHWREDHVLVLTPPAWAMRAAAIFRQHAVIVVRRGRTARLVLLPVRAIIA